MNEQRQDISGSVMVVALVFLVISFLISRHRWGGNLLARNEINPRTRFVFGNIIVNINRSETDI